MSTKRQALLKSEFSGNKVATRQLPACPEPWGFVSQKPAPCAKPWSVTHFRISEDWDPRPGGHGVFRHPISHTNLIPSPLSGEHSFSAA